MNSKNAESIAEKLHDFNPNLNVNVNPLTKKVHATINRLELDKEQLHALGDIADKNKVTFDRTGAKLRVVIG